MAAPQRRKQQSQIVLSVVERIQLAPHMVRIVAGGLGMSAVEDNGCTDAYSKMVFPQPGTDVVAPFTFDELRERLTPEQMPSVRTYTIRKFDLDAGQIWIDFVVHGDEGVAGPWAANAEPGDQVILGGIGGGYSPDPDADWHLFAGDESAIPAISSAIEALPADATGVALIEVYDAADEIAINAPSGVDIRWLHRGDVEAGTTTLLIDAVTALEWRDGVVQIFVHGERGAMKALRPYFTDVRGIDRRGMSLSAYWAYGRREDTFQAEKREEIGQI